MPDSPFSRPTPRDDLPPETALLIYGRVPSLLHETVSERLVARLHGGIPETSHETIYRSHAVAPPAPPLLDGEGSCLADEQLWLTSASAAPHKRPRMRNAIVDLLRCHDDRLADAITALDIARAVPSGEAGHLVGLLSRAAEMLIRERPFHQPAFDASQCCLTLAGVLGRDVGSLIQLGLRAETLARPDHSLRDRLRYGWMPPEHLSLALRQIAEVAINVARLFAVPQLMRSGRHGVR